MITRYAVLDTETTGLPDEPDARVIEVGISLYAMETHALLGTLAMVVRPDVIDPEGMKMAEGLTGITQAEVEAAPSVEQAVAVIGHFLGGWSYPVFCWNLEFDQLLYERTLGRGPWWSGCVMQEFSCRWVRVLGTDPETGYPRRSSLRRAAGIAGVSWEGRAHRALADALVTGEILRLLRTNQIAPPEPVDGGTDLIVVGEDRHAAPVDPRANEGVIVLGADRAASSAPPEAPSDPFPTSGVICVGASKRTNP
jgi:DNA polymerase III epsilon subunit-like protein